MDPERESKILHRALAGDARAFEALVEAHYDRVYGCAYRFCGTKEDAEDVAQEVFLKLAGKLRLFDGRASFATWLYRITVNTAKDLLRKKARTASVPYENGVHSPDNPGPDKAKHEEILQAVDKLPPKFREAVLLVYGEDLNHKQAAEVLGCAETTVSWRIFRAKRTLRKLLS